MNWYFKALKKYLVLGGRARRKEYWTFTLLNFLIGGVLLFIDGSLETGGYICALYILGTTAPEIGVTVRRLHDTGRSGMWFFVPLVPVIGSFVLLFFLLSEGSTGENEYGPDPKAEEAG